MAGLSVPKPATPGPNQDAPARADRLIEIRGLTKRFGDSYIYRNFDLDLREGEFISIFGPNGCGKSTFINLISGMIPIDEGGVLYDGKEFRQTRISYVFQNYREA